MTHAPPTPRSGAPPDLRVAWIAARQHGRVRLDQLASCGLSKHAVARRARAGRLHRVHRGVYAVGHAGATLDARFQAAVLAGGERATLSHWSSMALAGLVRWDDDRAIDVTIVGSSRRSLGGIRFHRARHLDELDITRMRGIPTTTPARAILEIAPQLSDQRLKRVIRQAQLEQKASTRQIAAVLRRANGHKGTARIAKIIATGPAPTASGDEDAVLDLLLASGFEHPEVNARLDVRTADRVADYVPDLRWPTQHVILEVDSAWHDTPLARRLDAEREADLQAAGERVLRTTADEALRDPRRLVDQLVAAGAPRTQETSERSALH